MFQRASHHPIIFMQCGPVRHRVNARAQAAAQSLSSTSSWSAPRLPPAGAANADPRFNSTNSAGELIADDKRNRLLCEEVVQAVREGRSPWY